MFQVKGLLFDVDGSIMPDGGPFSRLIMDLFWELGRFFPLGPVSGRPLEYLKGLGVGSGRHFQFAAAESGAVWATLKSSSPVIWDTRLTCPEDIGDLESLESLLQYNRRTGSFCLDGNRVECVDQPKMGEISMFSRGGTDLHALASALRATISQHSLQLKVVCFPDGSLTIAPQRSHKGLSVILACEHLACQPHELLTVVDGINDLELAQDTTCIAVGNASEDLKKVVRSRGTRGYVASSTEAMGFAEGLVHFARAGILPEEVSTLVQRTL